MKNKNKLLSLFPKISKDVEILLTNSLEFAYSNNHSIFRIEHILYAIMQFLQTSNPTSEFYTFATQNTPTFDFSNIDKSTYEFSFDMDVLALAQFFNTVINNSQIDSINLEYFYFMVLFANSYNTFSREYHLYRPSETYLSLRKFRQACYKNSLYTSPIKIKYTIDLTHKAYESKLSPIFGRANELYLMTTILSKMFKNNPVLIGEPGVGKTSLVHGLAQKIVTNQCSKLNGYHILELDVSSSLAGAKYRGEFEERIQMTLNEIYSLIEHGKKIILYIDEIHTIVDTGKAEGALDLGTVLKPHLLNPSIKIIGTSTLKEYRAIEADKALARRFDTVMVNEPTIDETLHILTGLSHSFEEFYNVTISQSILKSVITLSQRYIPESFLPDKAINLLDYCCSIHTINTSTSNEISSVDVFKAISTLTKIPIQQISNGYDLSKLDNILRSKVIGQNHACDSIAKAVRRTQAGLNDEGKPLASFMFIGPTGVGKTETAKALSDAVFSGKMIRFDMSEYMEEHSVSKLIGSPPGYVGYEDAGLLTEQVRRNPYSLVLFDEIEKAHPKICNLLLQILDEGSLTDSKGEHINFKNTIVILTSNVGIQELSKNTVGFVESAGSKSKDVITAVKQSFSPEFLNRFDEIIQFHQLSQQDILEIASMHISTLVKKLKNRNINISICEDVLTWISTIGYNPEYGARELKRTIAKEIITPLSDFLLHNSDCSLISVKLVDNKVEFSPNVVLL